MTTLIDKLIDDAKGSPKRIALPECEAPNTLLAVSPTTASARRCW